MSIDSQSDVTVAIAEIASLLVRQFEPNELVNELRSGLRRIDAARRMNPELVSPAQLAQLQQLAIKARAVRTFRELAPRLEDVIDEPECMALHSELGRLAETLAEAAIVQNIREERRRLLVQLPQQRQRAKLEADDRRTGVIRKLERAAPLCPKRHNQIIQTGVHGEFWSCTGYPQHQFKRPLTAEERASLSAP